MTPTDTLAQSFEEERPRLHAIAYRMLGSHQGAEDAVQDTWLHLARTGDEDIRSLPAWLTTAVGRVCLNMLRGQRSRPEVSLETSVPDPVVSPIDDPADRVAWRESVSVAMLVVMGRLNPDERVSFVLHDLFDVPFDPIAHLLEKSPAAARQLASRARRRVQLEAPAESSGPDGAGSGGQETVSAFFAAAQAGDFEALVRVLHPEVLLRCDGGDGPSELTLLLRGQRDVASQATMYGRLAPNLRPAWINGAPGVVVVVGGQVRSVMAFSVAGGRITEINVLADPQRLSAAIAGTWGDRR
ncbi:sigma-70 family RNA polymerase sigma factor [Ruania zhangjianzhongii]|uniref:sigma-70 family RNA polymerase sigma factor n=1 Tax=Ruania zhangjianzhongii TaxID=2603206 RepID=UPI0011CAF98A|nr:sigma-70 family RNA polymerase sigma factor [Ruania zhangjianzhongii]